MSAALDMNATEAIERLDEPAIVRIATALTNSAKELPGLGLDDVGEDGAVASEEQVARIAARILEGADPLGESLLRSRHTHQRRKAGQVFTPINLVDAMVGAAAAREGNNRINRIVDPGCGSGRFLSSAAKHWPEAELVGFELDPVCALITLANATVLGFRNRLHVVVGDYRQAILDANTGRTLFVGNPPYVRHHDLEASSKQWFVEASSRLGISKASQLAGLHIHFLIKTGLLAQRGDLGVFITSAEWLDTNYGKTLRSALLGQLGGVSVDVIDAKAEPFPGILSTGAITIFEVGSRPAVIRMGCIADPDAMTALGNGEPVDRETLMASDRWSCPRVPPLPLFAPIRVVGDLFRVSRGQVTGMNSVWVFGEDTPPVPERFLIPCVTGAEELFAATKFGCGLTKASSLKRVIDLPYSFDTLPPSERAMVARFLKWARARGAHRTYIARHRRPWWKVRLPKAPPILCTYMARRAPVFVRNHVAASLLNIAHGLYPARHVTDDELDAFCESLNRRVRLSDGRVYAGGLTKFEPGSVAALQL